MNLGRKNLFGYTQNTSSTSKRVNKTDWFDPSDILVKGEETLPDDETEKPRYILAQFLLLAAAALLFFRLTNLQITQGSTNRYLAEGNRIRRQITLAPRGAIVDRHGTNLVLNEPGYRLELIPSDLPLKQADRQTIYQQVADVTHIPVDTVVKEVQQAGFSSLDPIILQPDLARDDALVDEMKFAATSGVRVAFVPSRRYDSATGLAQILGYTSTMTGDDEKKHPDYYPGAPIVRAGVESSYDTYLRGHEGVDEIEVDANGKFQRDVQNIPPQEGDTLHLALDKGLEQEMADALKEQMDKNKVTQAAAVAMDPTTGGILASVSLPTYDNNLFAAGIKASDFQNLNNNPDKPLLDRVTQGEYPSGSTIKPFEAAGALQEGTIKPDTKLDTSAGKITIGPYSFPDWKVHGMTDVRQAIAESNDIFFYAVGGGYNQIPGLGVARMKKYLEQFGFGQSTDVDYTSDDAGLVPDETWKKKTIKEDWYVGDTYHMAIGQGFLLVTPLQLARATSAIANGGTLPTPHVVDGVESANSGKVTALSFPQSKVPIKPDAIQVVREGMRRTVTDGSARTLNTLPFTSAGKTGTAEFGTDKKTHAWYIGFAPYDNPQIAVAVIVEGGGEGNAISVPVASRVFSYYLNHK